jgi:hypothetical protein
MMAEERDPGFAVALRWAGQAGKKVSGTGRKNFIT